MKNSSISQSLILNLHVLKSLENVVTEDEFWVFFVNHT